MKSRAVDHSIAEVLKWAINQLSSVIDTASIDAHIILESAIEKDKLYVIMNRDEILEDVLVEKIYRWVERRVSGEPVQYIVGHQEFMGLDFYVDDNVLIPRSDTEPLVEAIIEIAKELPRQNSINIMDIGTGSGAITVSLAKYIECAQVTSADISKEALAIGKRNATQNGVADKIEFVNSDLFECFENEQDLNKFDIIVSNPPYIPSKDIDGLQVEVAEFEPRLALDGGHDGYDIYERIIRDAYKYLKINGILAFEVGYNQADRIKEMLLSSNYDNIRFVQDLSGINRIVIGALSNKE